MSGAGRVAINLRLSVELRETLRNAVRRKGRSVTAEVVRRLERSIRADERKERRWPRPEHEP
jgi:hypothetical protein